METVRQEAAAQVARLRRLVEQALPGLIEATREPAELYEPVRYVLSGTGKRMRPVLLMLAAELYYPDIGSVTITGGWHLRGDYPFSMEYTVVGDRGVAEYHSSERPAAVYWNGGGKELLPDDGADPYRAEVEYFAQCCRRGQPPGLCPPRESATAVRLARLICDARKRRREWIRIEGSLT